ncbi:hypothetical protein BCF33_2060 [Hasllibacter halocynthiae]|uniref:Flagellar hook-associated protein 3 FlgL n=1 Tax=Hasllibacter halocynthiae TaxID=595589 RepID=A0A2T0X2L3_9RHOB|nr:hypothetical protein [Hasllibacter halocynthiae]PRY93193.1 hypothetical protein BCF33_2060 [Hasllibacter halocynthiae]
MILGPFALQSDRIAAGLRDRLSENAEALSTGRAPGPLAGPDRTAVSHAAGRDRVAMAEADRLARFATRLEGLQGALDASGAQIAEAGRDGSPGAIRAALDGLLSRLDAPHGTGTLAGGAAPGGFVPSVEALVAAAGAVAAAVPDPEAARAAVAAWLAPGGAAEGAGLIRPGPLATAPPSSGAGVVDLGQRDPGLRRLIADLALGAVTPDADLRRSAAAALAGQGATAELAGRVGMIEMRVDRAGSEADAAGAAARRVIAEATGIDPFATATALQEAERQLETVYALTARLARLSLASRL